MKFPATTLQVPVWVEDFLAQSGLAHASVVARMRLAIELSRRNMAHGGGPFGACVFETASGRLLAPGVNLVVSSRCSAAHAEMVAVSAAQQVVGGYDLGGPGRPACELVTSTEPCAMCLGAVPWCGVRRLVCGAREEDARQIGFDEGDKPADWVQSLERRGIAVVRDVCRDEAAAVLRQYAAQGGLIYNARQAGGRTK